MPLRATKDDLADELKKIVMKTHIVDELNKDNDFNLFGE